MKLWHPHGETPAGPGQVAVIAILLGDPEPRPTLADGLYRYFGGRRVSESDQPHRRVLDEPVFWWCAETDLLDALIAEHDIEVTP